MSDRARGRLGFAPPAPLAVLSVFLVLDLAALSAAAQSNKLFGGQTAPRVPTSQPTVAPAHAGPAGPGRAAQQGVRQAVQQQLMLPKPNDTLLRTSPFAVPVPDPSRIGVNDQVTVIVRISKTATTSSKLESKKDWKHEWELQKWIKLSDENGLLPALFEQGNPAVGFDAKDDWGGDGKYDRKDELTTRIQATVIDVKPNGLLVLEARNEVDFGEEGYDLTLTGTCRSQDVTPQNTVLSSQIADLRVDVKETGAVKDATRRGWLKKGVDFMRPW